MESWRETGLVLAERAIGLVDGLRSGFNARCSGYESWQIALISACLTMAVVRLLALLDAPEGPWLRLKKGLFRAVRRLPYVGARIEREVAKAVAAVHESLLKPVPAVHAFQTLPARGLAPDQVLRELEFARSMDSVDWASGSCSGTVYHGGREHTKVLLDAYALFAWSNPLHPDVFASVRKLESEVIAMIVDLFRGGPDACGSVTSGGTESILMACKAYRDWARHERGITRPNMVLATSAHAAFDKAAHYFGIQAIKVPVDARTGEVDVRAVARAIGKNTILVVASAPSFPHGILDPVAELARIARRRRIGLHVDACLGSFLLPFAEKAGFPVGPFDFRVDGVTSISCDTHKYGFALKGSSVLLYATRALRRHQYHVAPDWPGGIYASPAVAGSRPGAVIAATWAALVHIGEDGYLASCKKILATQRRILAASRAIPGLQVIGDPQLSVIAFTSSAFDVLRLADALEHRGWNLNRLQFPSAIHMCVTLLHTPEDVSARFLQDLTSCTAEIMKTPTAKSTGSAAIYGMAASVPDRSIVEDIARGFVDGCYALAPTE